MIELWIIILYKENIFEAVTAVNISTYDIPFRRCLSSNLL